MSFPLAPGLPRARLVHYLILAIQDDPEEIEDFNPMDMYGGNFDDTYDGGYRNGRAEMAVDMARAFLTDLGFDWIVWKDIKKDGPPNHGDVIYGMNNEGNVWVEEWNTFEPVGNTKLWRLVE